MSFTPSRRFTTDSIKSPAVDATTITGATSSPYHHGCPTIMRVTMATRADPIIEPASPSQLFLGEIFGAMGCLPQFTPAI